MLVKQLSSDELGISYAGSAVLWDRGGGHDLDVERGGIFSWEYGGVESGYYAGSLVRFDPSIILYDKPLAEKRIDGLPWLYSVYSSEHLAWNKVMKYSNHLSAVRADHGFGGLWALYRAVEAGMFFVPDLKFIFPVYPVKSIFADGSYNADPYLIMTRKGGIPLFEIGVVSRADDIKAGTRLVIAGSKYEPEKYTAALSTSLRHGRKR